MIIILMQIMLVLTMMTMVLIAIETQMMEIIEIMVHINADNGSGGTKLQIRTMNI